MLSTIRLPKNLKLLTDRLPKSKYDDDQQHSRQQLLQETQSTKSIRTVPDDPHQSKNSKAQEHDLGNYDQ